MKRVLAVATIAGALFSARALAQGDNSERGVARISVISGDVSVRRGDSGEFVAAAINAPVVVPDTVTAGAASRAEIQLDYANMIRLAAATEVRFSELQYRRYQVQIARGTVTFSVVRDSDADVDLATPNVSVRPVRKGRYRVTVREDGTTEITVRSGEAEIFTPKGAESLKPGRTMVVRGTASDPEFQLVAAVAEDSWDDWNQKRDKELGRSESYRYVSRDVYGVEDLDLYGQWRYVPPYGWVWSPYAAAGWAPYRYGRWGWMDWYGWNWISYDPWGWAPYHYGRWFHHGPYGWCWWPGGMYARHYWSPGLVAFFGWGHHSGFSFGIGFGFGHVGWVPLAPYEAYYPWYGRHHYHGYRSHGYGGHTYIDNSVNIVNNVNVTNIYRNARIDNAITAVNGEDFGRGRVSNVHRASSAELQRVNLVRGQVPVVPQRESLHFSDRQVRAENVALRTRDSFAGRRQPARLDSVPFNEQQRGVEQFARGLSERGEALRATGPAGTAVSPRAGNQAPSRSAAEAPGGRSSSWSASEPGRAAGGPARENSAGTASEGWRRFGEPLRTRPDASGPAGRSSDAGGAPAGRSAEASTFSSGGWRRFGEPTRSPQAAGSDEPQGDRGTLGDRIGRSSRGWDSLGGRESRGGDSSPAPSATEPGSGRERGGGRWFDRFDPWGGSRSDESRSVPIGPDMPRERSSPRSGGGVFGDVFGRGDNSPRGGGGGERMESGGASPRWGGGGGMESGSSPRWGGGGGGRMESGGGGGRGGGGMEGSRGGGGAAPSGGADGGSPRGGGGGRGRGR